MLPSPCSRITPAWYRSEVWKKTPRFPSNYQQLLTYVQPSISQARIFSLAFLLFVLWPSPPSLLRLSSWYPSRFSVKLFDLSLQGYISLLPVLVATCSPFFCSFCRHPLELALLIIVHPVFPSAAAHTTSAPMTMRARNDVRARSKERPPSVVATDPLRILCPRRHTVLWLR